MDQDRFDIAQEGNKILADTRITGNIKSVQDICLDGVIEGNVLVERCVINHSGVIDGDIRCDELYIQGKVTGNVYAARKVVMGARAEIQGELVTACLEITPGAKTGVGLKLKNASK